MGQLFPKEDLYNAEILRASVESGTPYSVLKGFIALESAFDAKAYRYEAHINDASYGLAQILVRTARGVGFQGEPAELFDPYKSVLYGGKFIRQLSAKYPDVLDLIAAYNAGFPRKIRQTTQYIADLYGYPIKYREEPPVGWVYANEPYVRRVASYIAYYQAREKNDVARAEEILGLIKKKDLTTASAMLKPLTSGPERAEVKFCPRCHSPLP